MGERRKLLQGAKNFNLTFLEKCDRISQKEEIKMPRTKNLNIVVSYGKTGYVINDLGPDKSPRFELYYIPDKKTIKKSNNPLDFDDILFEVWKKEGKIEDV